MNLRRRSVSLLLFLTSFSISGCHSSHATPPPQPAAAKAPAPAALPGKHPPRESEFTVYHNPDYGVSFRYPRNYPLEEGIEEDDSPLLHHQQEIVAAEQPGALMLATVLIPGDDFPNTTFRDGYLQFAVNPGVSAAACRSFVVPQFSDARPATGKLMIQGIPFFWREHDFVSVDSASTIRDFAGYANGNCYEFFLQISSAPNPSADGPSSPADVKRVLRSFLKMIESLQLPTAATRATAGALPGTVSLPIVVFFT